MIHILVDSMMCHLVESTGLRFLFLFQFGVTVTEDMGRL